MLHNTMLNKHGPYDQFILFGDSITQQSCSQELGFALTPALQDAFIRKLDVINRGFSAYNTIGALQVLPTFMPTLDQAKVRFVMIFFGANDACLPGTTGQHVPLNIYKQNLRDIITHPTIVLHNPRIILVTVPPINEYALEATDYAEEIPYKSRTAEETKKYADATCEVGNQLGVAILDLWSVFMKCAGWKEGQPLAGSTKVPKNEVLDALLRDGSANSLFNPLAVHAQQLDENPSAPRLGEGVQYQVGGWWTAIRRRRNRAEEGTRGVRRRAIDPAILKRLNDRNKIGVTILERVDPSASDPVGMEPQFGLASRDDLWRLQNEMKNVYATQAEHADRLMRLEQRQDNDARVKSVWGNQSPFPSLLNGTPQQDSGYNPAAEAFKNFDQDQPNSLLGSLHLDAEDEPRRGASRANSVRFDESALHGHYGHTSRSSTEYLPIGTGSGLGSHPMTERSSSHKSDGRQSSAGQSTHSARASSFGFESRPLSATVAPFVPLGPPPGLFILGPAPSIIRCWLDTKFSNESLLYAAVCTGSFQSTLDYALASKLGFDDRITTNPQGNQSIKLPVYLPEATVQQSSSRATSPAPRLPTLTVEFTIQHLPAKPDTIQVFLGCDILRLQSADILFSLDRMTLFDDERNKVAVPLVRPENASMFQSLRITSLDSEASKNLTSLNSSNPMNASSDKLGETLDMKLKLASKIKDQFSEQVKVQPSSVATTTPLSSSPSVIGEGRRPLGDRDDSDKPVTTKLGTENVTNGNTPDTPTKAEGANIWGSWRRDSMQNGRSDLSSTASTTTSGYQRAGRGRGMKVLKPARLNTSRSAIQPLVGFGDVAKISGQQIMTENQNTSSPNIEMRPSGDGKIPLQSLTNKPRSANPIGGASAFGWLNSSEQKQSPTPSD